VEVDNEKLITKFARDHIRSEASMNQWLQAVKNARWNRPTDVVSTFNTADCIKGTWIFNIGGGKFRLAASIRFPEKALRVLDVMTHAEYDKGKWK
jgi:mRNA interferase HigB